MSSGELEQIIIRNGDFLSILRAGEGDGRAGLYTATGQYVCGIQSGCVPEYSRTEEGRPGGSLVRGWRNILYELLCRKRIRPTREVKRILGGREAQAAFDYGLVNSPMSTPEPDTQVRGGVWI